MEHLDIYIDGSKLDLPNHSPGGYAYLAIKNGEIIKEGFGLVVRDKITSARAELEALYQSLLWISEYIKEHKDTMFHIYSDYLTIVKCLSGESKRMKNRDIWDDIEPLCLELLGHIDIQHVKAHADDEFNKRCDKLAKQGANSLIKVA